MVHTASPFVIKAPKHEDDLIKPAVEGTRAVVSAAIKNGVKRIVITSSCAAIYVQKGNSKSKMSADDWTDLDDPAISAYVKSKTLAEQKAWEMQK